MNFSNKLSPKRIFSLFAAAVMTFSATACTENFENTDFPVADNFDNYLPNKEEVQLRVLTDKSQNEVNLTVWSWKVPSAEYA